jgi:hypothetical protein
LPRGETREHVIPALQWEISEKGILYRGRKADLPFFLPCFEIPVRAEWFDVLFSAYKEKSHTIYRDDAFVVATGYVAYSRAEAYLQGRWLKALQKGFFAVQVEWAESQRAGADRSLAAMQVSILRPNNNQDALEKQRTSGTTQGRFLAFLKSGKLEDLELGE